MFEATRLLYVGSHFGKLFPNELVCKFNLGKKTSLYYVYIDTNIDM